jgi:anti-anti-sigma regulatory factor
MNAAPLRTRRLLVAEMGRTYHSTDRDGLRALTRKLSGLVHDPDAAGVVVDLAGVEDFGAGLLGALVRLHAEAERLGKPVALCGLSAHARFVLRLTRLDAVWLLAPNRQAACAILGGGQPLAHAPL